MQCDSITKLSAMLSHTVTKLAVARSTPRPVDVRQLCLPSLLVVESHLEEVLHADLRHLRAEK